MASAPKWLLSRSMLHTCVGAGMVWGRVNVPCIPLSAPLGYTVLMHLDAPPLGTPPHLPVFVLCVGRHVA